jgi:predicted nucleic acid-binding Zn ribbon protein
MPLYPFAHPGTGEIKDIFFHMNEEPKEFTDKEGVRWRREWNSPQLNTQGSIDPWSNSDFVDKTKGKGTMGDLLDRSAELSDKRAQEVGGKDPLKEKYYKKYAKDRKGSPHPDTVNKTFENKNFKIELD